MCGRVVLVFSEERRQAIGRRGARGEAAVAKYGRIVNYSVVYRVAHVSSYSYLPRHDMARLKDACFHQIQ